MMRNPFNNIQTVEKPRCTGETITRVACFKIRASNQMWSQQGRPLFLITIAESAWFVWINETQIDRRSFTDRCSKTENNKRDS